MSKFCKTCNSWGVSYTTYNGRMGVCINDQVNNSIEKDTHATKSEDGVLHTNENFGCIYHRVSTLNVTDIKAMAKEFADSILPKEELKVCELCNATNCINNLTCHHCDNAFS